MSLLFEAVPNFSEGRDEAKIARIADAVRAVEGVRVLGLHTDPDHNRSVLTFAGTEEPLVEASLALMRACTEEIDLSSQTGVHPRMGVLDVLPFVPLQGATIKDATRLARRVGEEIGTLGIPVYLYEAAATAPHRRNLAAVREGGYEGLAERIRDPRWQPDFGPYRLSPKTGAVAVGARHFLIAFNAYLNTPDVEPAKEIAAEVRERDGGLPGLKALGLRVGERAQVSMNLTDLHRTSVPAALEAVRDGASRRKLKVEETELVGLMPLSALLETARHYLALPELLPQQVLEAGFWSDVEGERDD